MKTVRSVTAELFTRYDSMIKTKIAEYGDRFIADPRLSLENLTWMCTTAVKHQDDMSEDKMSRWLGFVQGCLAMRGMIDCDQERELSRPLFRAAHNTPQETRERTVE